MGIPGEDLPNTFPALSFVGWYNGHPDYCDLPIDLSCEWAIVVGNGNVAMDVTRLLVLSPDTLLKTDIADHALEKLRQSKIREVVVLGRRGAAQAAFTAPEIKELGKLEGVDVVVDPHNIELDPASLVDIEADRTAKANLECLHEYATRTEHTAPRRITMRFLASPVEIVGWAKRGPTALIGNNKPHSAATVEAMLADVPTLQGIRDELRDLSWVVAYLRERGIDYVTYQDWKILDQ